MTMRLFFTLWNEDVLKLIDLKSPLISLNLSKDLKIRAHSTQNSTFKFNMIFIFNTSSIKIKHLKSM